jgi:hypothetical protein
MSAYENQRFVQDPLKYARDVCINPQTASGSGTTLGGFDANSAYQTCYVDLVPWSSSFFSAASQVMPAFQTGAGAGLIPAYYVPYLAYGTITSNGQTPVLLDNIPTTAPLHDFVFTGGQNGCSLLVLAGTNANTISTIHYPNSDGKAKGYPLLAQVNRTAAQIIFSLDFDFYGETKNPNACSFLYHNGTEWIGVTQPQVQGVPSTTWKRSSMTINKAKGARFISATASGVIN